MANEGPFLLEITLRNVNTDSRIAYDELYKGFDLSQIKSFYLWLIEKIQLPDHGRLLDVSCGAGEVVKLASEQGIETVGVDISETVAHIAQQKVGINSNICVSEGENLPFPNKSFDIVTNIGSLEHYNNPARGVQEMARVLKPGGNAHILVPNIFSLLTNIWFAFRTGGLSIDDQPIQRYGTRSDWILLLEKNGLHVKRTIKYERPWPQTIDDWDYYLHEPKEMLRLLATPFIPINLAFCFLFTCKKIN